MADLKKTTLDKDLKKYRKLESATVEAGFPGMKLALGGLLLLFLFVAAVFDVLPAGGNFLVVVAIVIGGYMAINIGANDVANTMGPAVASRALTMFWALVIAASFNLLGAVVAGGDVTSTVSKGIIDPMAVGDPQVFVWAMMGALLAAAVWVNVATYVGAPVSTTHSIVGGVMGAGIAAASFSAVDWSVMGKIAASWVISPVMGGTIAAVLLWLVKILVLYREDKVEAARKWAPMFVAIMTSAFSVYLVMKGLKKLWKPDLEVLIAIGVGAFVVGWAVVSPIVRRAAVGMPNERKAVARLFTIPLICSTALLAFAHGANDVANAVGPLAAIVSVTQTGGIAAKVAIPMWILVVGGAGIAVGLSLFGPRLIRAVGEKITKLNIIRAYAVALAAAITVIIASALGLPVSSTHVAIGGIFGVGFLREALASRQFLYAFSNSLAIGKLNNGEVGAPKEERKAYAKLKKRRLVRRRYFLSIIAAWLITVPLAALMGALFFYTVRGIMLP